MAGIRELLDFAEKDKKLWATMKSAYAELIWSCQDIELAETFFNSVSRRIFTTIGVDPRIEFLFSDFDPPAEAPNPPIFLTYPASGTLAELISQVLTACEFEAPFEDPVVTLTWRLRPSNASTRSRATPGQSMPST